MTKIVVLGGGFAGVAVARRLEKKLRRDEAEIALVSRDNFTLFTPMLPEVSSGGLEPRHVATPVRAQLRRTTFVLGEIARLDLGGAPGRGAASADRRRDATRVRSARAGARFGDLDVRHPRRRGAHAAAQDARRRGDAAQSHHRGARAGRRHAAGTGTRRGCSPSPSSAAATPAASARASWSTSSTRSCASTGRCTSTTCA